MKYYFQSYWRLFLPYSNYKEKIQNLKNKLSKEQVDLAESRISYYYKLTEKSIFQNSKLTIRNLLNPKSPNAYYFDTYEYARFYPKYTPIDFAYGDVNTIFDSPKITKSRPITNNNANNILLNLDKARHFVWVEDEKEFLFKKKLLIGRGAIFQEHRMRFYETYFNHPLCDLGQTNKNAGKPEIWWKPKMSLKKHLDYKFILCLQGNDVATNLKWVMSSQSIAVMPKPTIESWFMEGKLVGGKHYIEINEDYSNLEEQLNYYIQHPEKCIQIIKNAHVHCQQFWNKNIEDYCSLRVLENCFK